MTFLLRPYFDTSDSTTSLNHFSGGAHIDIFNQYVYLLLTYLHLSVSALGFTIRGFDGLTLSLSLSSSDNTFSL